MQKSIWTEKKFKRGHEKPKKSDFEFFFSFHFQSILVFLSIVSPWSE